MEVLQILILSIIQGLTEFLPISSSAHLIISSSILGQETQSITVDIFAHGGSLFAVIIYFRVELADALKDYKFSSSDSFLNKLFLGSFPILIIGFFFREFISENLRTLDIIAISTIFFGILLWIADRTTKDQSSNESVTFKHAFFIGLAQCLALIPGTSRSAITIICALFLSYSRTIASKFAFMLAIPTLGIILLSEVISLGFSPLEINLLDVLLVLTFSFLSSYLCIGIFLKLIERIGFTPFVIYRVLLGTFLLFLAY
jgi:undecaprenyl-diphosphatase